MPLSVLERMRDELIDYRGTGMSVMEMSHRSPEFEAIKCMGYSLHDIRPIDPQPRGDERQEHVVELVGVTSIWLGLGTDAPDRVGIQPTEFARLDRKATP